VLGDASWVAQTSVICQNPKVTAINTCMETDLTGQVCADSMGTVMFSGKDMIHTFWQYNVTVLHYTWYGNRNQLFYLSQIFPTVFSLTPSEHTPRIIIWTISSELYWFLFLVFKIIIFVMLPCGWVQPVHMGVVWLRCLGGLEHGERGSASL